MIIKFWKENNIVYLDDTYRLTYNLLKQNSSEKKNIIACFTDSTPAQNKIQPFSNKNIPQGLRAAKGEGGWERTIVNISS